jgi:hypothetical protein
MAITIGLAATHRTADNWTNNGYTTINIGAADGTGTFDTVEVYHSSNIKGLKIGTFYSTGTSKFRCRDYADLGNVSLSGYGSFTGLSIDGQTGDYAGCVNGQNWSWDSGSPGGWWQAGDLTDGSEYTLTGAYSPRLSLYLTGTETAAGGQPLKNVFGRPFRGCFR